MIVLNRTRMAAMFTASSDTTDDLNASAFDNSKIISFDVNGRLHYVFVSI